MLAAQVTPTRGPPPLPLPPLSPGQCGDVACHAAMQLCRRVKKHAIDNTYCFEMGQRRQWPECQVGCGLPHQTDIMRQELFVLEQARPTDMP